MKYETFELNEMGAEAALDALNSIKLGDLVKCNDWKMPLRVIGVSENYFVMARPAFGQMQYSICEKKLCDFSRNNFTAGNYRIGRDNYVFGPGFDNDCEPGGIEITEYLKELETGQTELSVRATVNLTTISIKRRELLEEK